MIEELKGNSIIVNAEWLEGNDPEREKQKTKGGIKMDNKEMKAEVLRVWVDGNRPGYTTHHCGECGAKIVQMRRKDMAPAQEVHKCKREVK